MLYCLFAVLETLNFMCQLMHWMSFDFSLNHAENVGYYLLSPVLTGITGVQFSLAF